MVACRRSKNHYHRRGGASWTAVDDAAYERYLADLRLVHCGEMSSALRSVLIRCSD